VRRVLLDTHTWLWWMTGGRRLGERASALVRRADEAHFSAASAWEMSIKTGLGQLELPAGFDLAQELEQGSFEMLPVSVDHAVAIRALPPLHRDPFDRMLIAQARVEGLTIITADEAIMPFEGNSFESLAAKHIAEPAPAMRYDVPAIDART
jgi:PIN domain nuclease of toxin-antitoxin system